VTKIQKRMSMIFFILNIIQIIVIGSYVFYVMINFSKNEIASASQQSLSEMIYNMDRKIMMIENYSRIIDKNEKIFNLILSHNWSSLDGDYLLNSGYLDKELAQAFYEIDNIEGVIIFPKNGGSYFYKNNDLDADKLAGSDWFKKISKSGGELLWLGNQTLPTKYESSKTFFVAGRKMMTLNSAFSNNSYISDLGDVIFLFNSDKFLPNFIDYKDKICVTNAVGDVIHSTLKDADSVINVNKFEPHYLKFEGSQYFASYKKSDMTGWHFYYFRQTESLVKNILYLLIIMSFIFLLSLITVNIVFYFETKRIFHPLTDIMKAMTDIGNNRFDVHIQTQKDNELYLICDGINKMSKELELLMKKTILIENQKKTEQIRALQYQMNPHFLYNTLASMKMVALSHNIMPIAENIEVLSRLLRNTLNKNDELITIDFEINNVMDYITLQQFRYKNRIFVFLRADESVRQCEIPNLLIQPIVENAVMHGLSEKLNQNKQAVLLIDILDCADNVTISIFDNGCGISGDDKLMKPKEKGIGLGNVNDRIRLIYGDQYGLTVESEKDKFTMVEIQIEKRFLKQTQERGSIHDSLGNC